jgi:hypothetical protein
VAAGLTSETVQKAVDECNQAMQKIDAEIDGGLNSLDTVADLRKIAGDLHAQWQTENGERTMIELFKVFDTLDTCMQNFITAANNIKNDKYTFTKDSTTEYDWK